MKSKFVYVSPDYQTNWHTFSYHDDLDMQYLGLPEGAKVSEEGHVVVSPGCKSPKVLAWREAVDAEGRCHCWKEEWTPSHGWRVTCHWRGNL